MVNTSYELGRYQNRTYFVRIRDEPTRGSESTFTVTVYYRDPEAYENVEIARVDDEHGYRHFDRLYRRDEKKDPVDWGPWDAFDHFLHSWRRYAERYEKTWGNS